MFKPTTYSFSDLSGAIAHPLLGAYTFTGEGVGQIDIVMTTEKTAHNVAADGSIMVSKIPGNNGTISIQCQQTSAVHKWLLSAYNSLLIADTDQWAMMTATMRNTADGSSHVSMGMSFQKKGDKSYQAQGQMVTWVLMAADIQSLPA